MSIKKELNDIIRTIEAQGFTVVLGRGGHYRATPPDKTKAIVHFASTPSDRRAINNIKAELRRSGANI